MSVQTLGLTMQRTYASTRWRTDEYITDWSQFARLVRSKGCHLLSRLNDFQNSILITGCQRSGTTMLSRIINKSEEITNYWFGPDDELDAALILSGYVDHQPRGRYCFQTTFVNECYSEYFADGNKFKMIWVLRNPHSVVFSMLYNWQRSHLEELFRACGMHHTSPSGRWFINLLGLKIVPPLYKACWSYSGKTAQLFEIAQKLDPKSLLVVDYDELVARKDMLLPKVFDFLELEYSPQLASLIKAGSLQKSTSLTRIQMNTIDRLCEREYFRARQMTVSAEAQVR